MDVALGRLLEVQQQISTRSAPEWDDESCEKLLLCPVAGLLHVEFYGSPFDESFEDLIKVLCAPEVAGSIRSLVFRGPDEGANGTRNWDFTRLLESEVEFPNLLSLFVEPTLPEHHNQTIIASVYAEEGQIGRLASKAPRLRSLTVPSAPDASFFQLGGLPLSHLRVDTGYETQGFILHLSQSSCFTQLSVLDFGDYNQRYMEDYPGSCTPFEHYQQMFRSRAFSSVSRFVLRNSVLSQEQFEELHRMQSSTQFLTIQAPEGSYVR